jgi:hypothetical protein
MSPPPAGGSEADARIEIDAALETAGWVVQNRAEMNLSGAQGVAVREFKLKQGHGYADYLLFVDGKAVGVLEAKAPGHTLIGVEPQSTRYAHGLPDGLDPPTLPLPFLYLSTGGVTKFTNLLDPEPRSRFIFHVHRPETLAEWLSAPTLDTWVKSNGAYTGADDSRPSSLRARLRAMPELDPGGLYPNQIQAITNLEASMRRDKPRALLQMATGSGKTLTSVAEIYRLIKFGGARRVLFLVDRSNLGEQAEKEFQNFETPDDHRKFTELYNVQRLTSNTIDAASRVVITTIQRLFSMLKGEAAFEEPEGDEAKLDDSDSLTKAPIPIAFNSTIPPEYFDVVFIDECHRSIYSLWRQVLEYFDAFLIGLTATPAKHTFGFFHKNLVMEYGHEQAVVDGVNSPSTRSPPVTSTASTCSGCGTSRWRTQPACPSPISSPRRSPTTSDPGSARSRTSWETWKREPRRGRGRALDDRPERAGASCRRAPRVRRRRWNRAGPCADRRRCGLADPETARGAVRQGRPDHQRAPEPRVRGGRARPGGNYPEVPDSSNRAKSHGFSPGRARGRALQPAGDHRGRLPRPVDPGHEVPAMGDRPAGRVPGEGLRHGRRAPGVHAQPRHRLL